MIKEAIKEIFKSFIFGLVTLIIINFIGYYFDFHLPINMFTIFLIGFLRIPGLIILIIILLL